MESLVSGIKQLNGVLVVVMPDCLLYSGWQRPGQTWDTEIVGAFLGELTRAHMDSLDAIEDWSSVNQVTLELDQALVILRRVKDPFVVGYIFEKSAAIGWARLQVQRTIRGIEQSLDSGQPIEEVSAPPPPPAPPSAPERVVVARTPAPPAPRSVPPPPATPPAPPAPSDAMPTASGFRGRSPSASPEATPAEIPPAPAVAVAKPSIPPVPPVPLTPEPAEPEAAAEPEAQEDNIPKGTRLIKYLDAHAPDTHAALLRVSLQTGLPLTLLRMPDSLSDDEFAQVEESVRRILGVEQLNF